MASLDLYRLIRPALFLLDAEDAHTLTIALMLRGLVPRFRADLHPELATEFCGLSVPNPIGLAAGFDKQAEVIEECFGLGFGFVEVGGVVPQPQAGNPKPRVFRVPEAEAIINRMNFNSDGYNAVARRLAAWNDTHHNAKKRILGINIAKGDEAADVMAAYVQGVQIFWSNVDFITINVSCPNTPDLRKLEGREQMTALLRAVIAARDVLPRKPKLLVKISPDQSPEQQEDIAAAVLDSGVDGLIVSNTTVSRPAGVPPAMAKEKGGLSGKPLFAMSTELLGNMYRLTQGRVPMIGVGGVASAEDAYAKIRAGASVVQLYTGLVYHGPALINRINHELVALIKRDGFETIADAVGADVT
jgi:dihydroorotate dehydrogenase